MDLESSITMIFFCLLTDIDECSKEQIDHFCRNGDCENYIGSYNCSCDEGFGNVCQHKGL